MEERRRLKRKEVSFLVVYKVDSPLVMRMIIGDKEIDAVAIDLSETGMAVLTSYEVLKDTRIHIKFAIMDGSAFKKEDRYKSIDIEGEVRYNIYAGEKKSYRLGINFIGLSESDRDFIVNFVRKNPPSR